MNKVCRLWGTIGDLEDIDGLKVNVLMQILIGS